MACGIETIYNITHKSLAVRVCGIHYTYFLSAYIHEYTHILG